MYNFLLLFVLLQFTFAQRYLNQVAKHSIDSQRDA